MKQIVVNTLALLLSLSLVYGQVSTRSANNTLILDSFKLPLVKGVFKNFDLIKAKTPVIGFTTGIYMPNEKIWLFKISDSSQLYDFKFCLKDTSLYYFFKYNSTVYLSNLKNNVSDNRQINTDLLILDTKHSYSIAPCGRLTYFLLVNDSVSKIFYCTPQSQEEIYENTAPISEIHAIDSSSLLVCYKNEIVYYSISKENQRTLFKSPLPIISSTVFSNGSVAISTKQGVFKVNKDLKAEQIQLSVSDGILRVYNDYLFVLSNEKHTIYKLQIQ